MDDTSLMCQCVIDRFGEIIEAIIEPNLVRIDDEFDNICKLVNEAPEKSYNYYPKLTNNKMGNKTILLYVCQKYDEHGFDCKMSKQCVIIKARKAEPISPGV